MDSAPLGGHRGAVCAVLLSSHTSSLSFVGSRTKLHTDCGWIEATPDFTSG